MSGRQETDTDRATGFERDVVIRSPSQFTRQGLHSARLCCVVETRNDQTVACASCVCVPRDRTSRVVCPDLGQIPSGRRREAHRNGRAGGERDGVIRSPSQVTRQVLHSARLCCVVETRNDQTVSG